MKKLSYLSFLLFVSSLLGQDVKIEKRAETVTVSYKGNTLIGGIACPPWNGSLDTLGEIGEVVLRKDARKLGKPELTNKISIDDARIILRMCESYVLVGVPGKGNLTFMTDSQYKFYSDGIVGEPYFYIFSKSMILELLNR